MSALLLAMAVALSSLGLGAQEQVAPFCGQGQRPSFQLGFGALKAELRSMMGDPVECEHGDPGSGDTVQRTTTGLAYYRPSSATVAFTNGFDHWALGPGGLSCWTGASVQPVSVLAWSTPATAPIWGASCPALGSSSTLGARRAAAPRT